MNGPLGRRCGLLHDIGKAADHEMEGGHPRGRCRAGSAATASRRKSSTPRSGTMTTCGSRRPTPCSSPRPTPSAPAGPVPGARPWKNTCGGSRSSNRSPWASRASSRPTRSRPAARSACSSTASSSTTPSRPSSAATSPSRFKAGLTYPGEVKVTVLRETPKRRIRPMSRPHLPQSDPQYHVTSHRACGEHVALKILFIGDVVGAPGRKIVGQVLPRLIPRWGLGLVVCNAENAAGGSGLTVEVPRRAGRGRRRRHDDGRPRLSQG